MALKLNGPKRWNGVKRKLQERHGVVVHFSSNHNLYYDVFKYVTKSDIDYLKSSEHPILDQISSPKTKKGLEQYRKRSKEHAAEKEKDVPPKKVARLQNLDVAELIIKEKLKDADNFFVVANLRLKAGNKDLARFYVNRNRKSIDDLFESSARLEKTPCPRCFLNLDLLGEPNIKIVFCSFYYRKTTRNQLVTINLL